MEKELKKEKKFLNLLIDLNPYAIVIYDADGYYISSNRAHFDLHKSFPPKEYCFFKDPIALKQNFWPETVKKLKNGDVCFVPRSAL